MADKPINRKALEAWLNEFAVQDYDAQMALLVLAYWNGDMTEVGAVTQANIVADPGKYLKKFNINVGTRKIVPVFDDDSVFHIAFPRKPPDGAKLGVSDIYKKGQMTIRCCADC